jgi:glycosyltransferase involved in cell wall biosynthesis
MALILTMIVKNESRALPAALAAAAPFVDGAAILDTGSTDDTVQVVQKICREQSLPFSLRTAKWLDDFAAARNASLELAEEAGADWMLVLDADEVIRTEAGETPADLRAFLQRQQKIHGNAFLGAIRRFDVYPGGVNRTFLPRILPRGVRYTGLVHEQPDTAFPCIAAPLSADHTGYRGEAAAEKAKRNLSLLDRMWQQNPGDPYLAYQMAVTAEGVGDGERAEACYEVFEKSIQGTEFPDPLPEYVTDGVLRHLYALMNAGNYTRILELLPAAEERLGSRSDYWFFLGLFYMNLVRSDPGRWIRELPKIELCYRRCLAIGEDPSIPGVAGTGSYLAFYNLGTWYEVTGNTGKARECYERAADLGYDPARERLQGI